MQRRVDFCPRASSSPVWRFFAQAILHLNVRYSEHENWSHGILFSPCGLSSQYLTPLGWLLWILWTRPYFAPLDQFSFFQFANKEMDCLDNFFIDSRSFTWVWMGEGAQTSMRCKRVGRVVVSAMYDFLSSNRTWSFSPMFSILPCLLSITLCL